MFYVSITFGHLGTEVVQLLCKKSKARMYYSYQSTSTVNLAAQWNITRGDLGAASDKLAGEEVLGVPSGEADGGWAGYAKG